MSTTAPEYLTTLRDGFADAVQQWVDQSTTAWDQWSQAWSPAAEAAGLGMPGAPGAAPGRGRRLVTSTRHGVVTTTARREGLRLWGSGEAVASMAVGTGLAAALETAAAASTARRRATGAGEHDHYEHDHHEHGHRRARPSGRVAAATPATAACRTADVIVRARAGEVRVVPFHAAQPVAPRARGALEVGPWHGCDGDDLEVRAVLEEREDRPAAVRGPGRPVADLDSRASTTTGRRARETPGRRTDAAGPSRAGRRRQRSEPGRAAARLASRSTSCVGARRRTSDVDVVRERLRGRPLRGVRTTATGGRRGAPRRSATPSRSAVTADAAARRAAMTDANNTHRRDAGPDHRAGPAGAAGAVDPGQAVARAGPGDPVRRRGPVVDERAYVDAVSREGARYWREAGALGPRLRQRADGARHPQRRPDHQRRVGGGGELAQRARGATESRATAPPAPPTERRRRHPARLAVLLRAAVGQTAQATVTVVNRHPRARRVELEPSELRDATGTVVALTLRVDPDHVTIPAGEEHQVRIEADLDEGVVQPGQRYVGTRGGQRRRRGHAGGDRRGRGLTSSAASASGAATSRGRPAPRGAAAAPRGPTAAGPGSPPATPARRRRPRGPAARHTRARAALAEVYQ